MTGVGRGPRRWGGGHERPHLVLVRAPAPVEGPTPPVVSTGRADAPARGASPAPVVRSFGGVEVHLYPAGCGGEAIGFVIAPRTVHRHLHVVQAPGSQARRHVSTTRSNAHYDAALVWAATHGFRPAQGEPHRASSGSGEPYDVSLLVGPRL